jgi:hypothetical protein
MKRERQEQRTKREYAFQNAPRCTAKSKRTGHRCNAPAVRGWKVCRFHGARGRSTQRQGKWCLEAWTLWSGSKGRAIYCKALAEGRRKPSEALVKRRDVTPIYAGSVYFGLRARDACDVMRQVCYVPRTDEAAQRRRWAEWRP